MSAQDALRVGAGDDEQRLALTIRLVDPMLDRIALLRIQRCERVQGVVRLARAAALTKGFRRQLPESSR
jgi:hypothetical protein